MKKITSIAFIALFTIPLFSHPQKAHACTPVSRTDQEMFDAVDSVFMGKIYSVTSNVKDEYSAEFTGKAEVLKSWKGNPSGIVDIKSASVLTCGSNFSQYDEGKIRLIYASKATSTGIYHIGLIRVIDTDSEYGNKLIALLNSGTFSSTTKPFAFTRNLTIGSTGADVIKLQELLEQKGFLIMPKGVAKGYFGAVTRNAVIKYQKSNGIIPAVGYFGAFTRDLITRN